MKYIVNFKRGRVFHSIAPIEAYDVISASKKAIELMRGDYGKSINHALGIPHWDWLTSDIEMVRELRLTTEQPTKHDTTPDKETAHDKINHSAP